MRVINSRNYVMATERVPAAYRPSNQARMVQARASNPSLTEADAYRPESGEVRWGNGRGDNGLAPRRLPQVQDRYLRTPMTNITGASPAVLPRAHAQPLTVPIVPADVAGLAAQNTTVPGVPVPTPIKPGWSERPWWQNTTVPGVPVPTPIKPGWSERPWWRQAVREEKLPRRMRRVHGTPMSWTSTPVDAPLRPITAVLLRPTPDQLVTRPMISRADVSGLAGLDTPSMLLAAGAVLGVFMLIRNR